MSYDTVCLDNQLKSLADNKKWEKILMFGKGLQENQKSRYIWVWPEKNFIVFIKNCLQDDLQITNILSVGCGSGLFEWIIEESTGLHVCGIEINEMWWTSKYSPMKFIQLFYADKEELNSDFLIKCAGTDNFILTFCYFNCQKSFRKYLQAYNGKYLMIIGPDSRNSKQIVFTEPAPFDLGLTAEENVWELFKFYEVDHNGNYAALYKRNV